MSYIYNLSDTWDAAGTTWYGIKMDVTNSASATGSKLISLGIGGVEKFGVDKNGNVGIGATPSFKLDVQDSTDVTVRVYNQNTASAAYSSFEAGNGNGVTTKMYSYVGAGWLGTTSNHPVLFQTNNSECARFDTSGNFGIGTTSPSTKLDVASTAGSSSAYTAMFRSTHTNGYSGLIGIGVAPTAAGAYTAAAFAAENTTGTANDGGTLKLYTATADASHTLTERMRIDSSGNVGIGTSGPSSRLDVRAPSGTTAVISSYNTTASGNVSGYYSDLQVNANSTGSYHYAGVTQGVNIWYLYGNGTSSWSSDQRLKKNIVTTRDGYLDDLNKLRVVRYNWRTDADDKPQELGLIAQEVEEVFPGLVEDALHTLDDTDIKYKVLKGSVLPYMLLKALQEASTQIDALTARVAQLEGH